MKSTGAPLRPDNEQLSLQQFTWFSDPRLTSDLFTKPAVQLRALLAHASIRGKLWFLITNLTDELSSMSVLINLIYICILGG